MVPRQGGWSQIAGWRLNTGILILQSEWRWQARA